MRDDHVIAIPRATRPEHVRESAGALAGTRRKRNRAIDRALAPAQVKPPVSPSAWPVGRGAVHPKAGAGFPVTYPNVVAMLSLLSVGSAKTRKGGHGIRYFTHAHWTLICAKALKFAVQALLREEPRQGDTMKDGPLGSSVAQPILPQPTATGMADAATSEDCKLDRWRSNGRHAIAEH